MARAMLLCAVLVACGEAPGPAQAPVADSLFALSSPAFREGGVIPLDYTGDGRNVSPPLAWSGVPEGTREFALTCRDLDGRHDDWIHWVVYGIPDSARSLPEDAGSWSEKNERRLPGAGYVGMDPTPGKAHRYRFTLYALDTRLAIPSDIVDVEMLEKAVAGHVLARAELTGTYARNPHMGGWWK